MPHPCTQEDAVSETMTETSLPSAANTHAGLQLVTVLHATVKGIAHNGPPLDMMTQLCAVVAHVDLKLAGHVARERLGFLFPG